MKKGHFCVVCLYSNQESIFWSQKQNKLQLLLIIKGPVSDAVEDKILDASKAEALLTDSCLVCLQAPR